MAGQPVGSARDRGLTLVEVLLAVSILGIGVTSLVGGMMTSITVSSRGQQSAEGLSAIRAYAEAVSAASYADCATSYPAPGFTAPAGWSAATPVVSYWNGSSFTATCGTDRGLQKVTLRLTAADGAVETVAIAKRKP